MRIAILTRYRRSVAGAEAYLAAVLPALSADNNLALISDQDGDTRRPPLELPNHSLAWSIDRLGRHAVVSELRTWRPDVIYNHGTKDAASEAAAVRLAPAVLMSHTYHGTCISGLKTCRRPAAAPCSRRFSPACLLHYFPRRCGGCNPLTMARLYLAERRRLRLLHEYRAVLTLSEHMRQEFLRHGVDAERVIKLPPLGFAECTAPSPRTPLPTADRPRRFLFLGRMEHMKGGHLLIQALPLAALSLGPLHLTLAGDGPERQRWESLAGEVTTAFRNVSIEFVGGIDEAEKRRMFSQTDALVVPSVWPEPYGLVGPEAARFGIPAVGFDVGGIREWLREGQTGCLAPGDPPTARALAGAMVRCASNQTLLRKLAEGASEFAASMDRNRHIDKLRQILSEAARLTP